MIAVAVLRSIELSLVWVVLGIRPILRSRRGFVGVVSDSAFILGGHSRRL